MTIDAAIDRDPVFAEGHAELLRRGDDVRHRVHDIVAPDATMLVAIGWV